MDPASPAAFVRRLGAGTRIALAIALVATAVGAWWLIRPVRQPAQPEPGIEQTSSSEAAIARTSAAAPSEVAARVPPKNRQDVLRRQFQWAAGSYVFTAKVTDPAIRALLSEFRVIDAIALTRKRAAAGSTDALILLSEMSELCAWRNWDGAKRTRAQSDEGQVSVRASAAKLPASLRENIETALEVDRQSLDAWLDACADVDLDRGEITRQLRAKADTGDAASLRQLASTAMIREEELPRLLLSAAMLGDKDAQVQLAASYYYEVTRNNDQKNVEQMIYWLEAAAKHSPHGQYMLGECRLVGCDGEAADIEGGLRLLREAARRGDAFALKLLADTIAAGTGSFTGEEQYAWLTFERELLDTGCVTPASYPGARIDNWQRIETVRRSLSPHALSSAQALGEEYWRAYGAQALEGFGCR